MNIISEYVYGDNYDKAFQEFTFEKWCDSVKKIAKKLANDGYLGENEEKAWLNQIEKDNVAEYIVAHSISWSSDTYFGLDTEHIDEWSIFRIILEGFDDEESVVLDFGSLVAGGWCDEIPDESEFNHSKIIILTEGSSDSEFISRSLKLLYPHLSKFFSFMDFEIMHVNGSASYLVHYIKAFAGAGISNKIIGIFDNDTAALNELKNLKGIPLPSNIKVLKLPEIEIAQDYPTIGPTQNQNLDINGQACSIELFLGNDVLKKEDGNFTPIIWTNYVHELGKYQGSMLNKDKKDVHEKFRNKLCLAETGQEIDPVNWKEMVILLESITHAFD